MEPGGSMPHSQGLSNNPYQVLEHLKMFLLKFCDRRPRWLIASLPRVLEANYLI